MRRVLLAALIAVAAVGWARGASATEMSYTWGLDPPPLGPNATAAADGSVLTLIGGGSVGGEGAAQGHGVFQLADRDGNIVSAGAWTVSGDGSVQDQGPLPEEPWDHVAQRGVVTVPISLDGVGDGTLTVYCAAGRTHLEGFHAKIGKVSYRRIVTGASILMRSPI